MPIFYRGAGIGTYWYLNNPIENGFTARSPEMTTSLTPVDVSYCKEYC